MSAQFCVPAASTNQVGISNFHRSQFHGGIEYLAFAVGLSGHGYALKSFIPDKRKFRKKKGQKILILIASHQLGWRNSFFEAMHEVQMEILKAKIHKAYGPMMEQAADALLESMRLLGIKNRGIARR